MTSAAATVAVYVSDADEALRSWTGQVASRCAPIAPWAPRAGSRWLRRALEANGVALSQPLSDMPWGKFASFLDPEGYEYGIREASVRSQWRARPRGG